MRHYGSVTEGELLEGRKMVEEMGALSKSGENGGFMRFLGCFEVKIVLF